MNRGRIVVFNHLDVFSPAQTTTRGNRDNRGACATDCEASCREAAADFYLWACRHHDGGRHAAFRARDPKRYSSLTHAILVEHTDALGETKPKRRAGRRALTINARLTWTKGWPEIKSALGTGQAQPHDDHKSQTTDGCIGDLLVICGELVLLSDQGPPYYHTDHDTIDKISRAGIEAAVDSTCGCSS